MTSVALFVLVLIYPPNYSRGVQVVVVPGFYQSRPACDVAGLEWVHQAPHDWTTPAYACLPAPAKP